MGEGNGERKLPMPNVEGIASLRRWVNEQFDLIELGVAAEDHMAVLEILHDVHESIENTILKSVTELVIFDESLEMPAWVAVAKMPLSEYTRKQERIKKARGN